MKTAVDEISSRIDESRPAHGIRTDECDAVTAQQLDEILRKEAVVADFDGMAQGAVFV